MKEVNWLLVAEAAFGAMIFCGLLAIVLLIAQRRTDDRMEDDD